MHLKKLTLYDFKNYEEAHFTFDNKVNCFLGKNGVGKTNILDGIYYLGFTKSALNGVDAQNIRHGKNQFIVKGQFSRNNQSAEVICSYAIGSKKIIREDGNDTKKLSDHIGRYPIVLVAPNDIELIWGGSELRRKFFDSLIAQLDKNYLEHLIIYTNQLKQRNSLLKFSADRRLDYDLLETYDQRLIHSGNYIHQKRAAFITSFLPLFKDHYAFLSGEAEEEVDIEYKSDCTDQDFGVMLKNSIKRDVILQRTSVGIHRDDFVFTLGAFELKRIGSQGQQKSFLIGLKLAEFQSIENVKKIKPLLLLDDIFDKLDDERIHKLVALVVDGTFGQLFITDARPDRSRKLLEDANVDAELFLIDAGKLVEV
ncbi:MAG: DNA replication and repair protein RecF [Cyclobacteriaceae bacterium]|nr:DNA replication and repair protein RecF [Cyclobacteriaceae bacterium]